MVFLIIHNEYQHRGGEESVVDFQKNLLEQHGHKVILYTRNYHELGDSSWGRIKSIFTSIYNPKSIKDIKRIVRQEKPNVAIIHNVFSIISPAIIPALKKMNVKVWQIVHNYRMFCPIGIFFHNGKICEQCLKAGREFHCAINNCTNNIVQSWAFAFKFFIVRKLNYYKGVDRFLCLNRKQIKQLNQYGIEKSRLHLLPNAISGYPLQETRRIEEKKYIGFAGRLTKEKGVEDLIKLAKLLPNYVFRIAGSTATGFDIKRVPANIEFLGFLNKREIIEFYSTNRVLLFLSHWYETFGLTAIESMACSTPVITYSVNAASEIIDNELDGFIVEDFDLNKVVRRIERLFSDNEGYSIMCQNALDKVKQRYTEEQYYENLINI